VHEMSLALEVCRLAEAHLPGPPPPRVLAVGVEVGRAAGVEPANLRFCLEALLAEPPFLGARAELLERPGGDLRLAWVEVDDGDPDD
jgi:Zn finger protein HypA/HybF involved in hydrogenase expression